MNARAGTLAILAGLLAASCVAGDTGEPATGDLADTAFHAVPADTVLVTGTASCVPSDDGTDPTGGDATDLVTCQLEMSDPRVSGTETHDRFRYHEVEQGWVWVVEDAVITNADGTWRGTAQAADDGMPIGEARYVGEGQYEGLVFHYYFSAPTGYDAVVHGWIASDS